MSKSSVEDILGMNDMVSHLFFYCRHSFETRHQYNHVNILEKCFLKISQRKNAPKTDIYMLKSL